MTSKSYWRNAKTSAINQALNNDYLKREGLVSLRDGWIILINRLSETPCAEPHAGYC